MTKSDPVPLLLTGEGMRLCPRFASVRAVRLAPEPAGGSGRRVDASGGPENSGPELELKVGAELRESVPLSKDSSPPLSLCKL